MKTLSLVLSVILVMAPVAQVLDKAVENEEKF